MSVARLIACERFCALGAIMNLHVPMPIKTSKENSSRVVVAQGRLTGHRGRHN
jgi:hypothetical protein